MSLGLWVRPDDLHDSVASDPLAMEACQFASHVLWAFSGRKFIPFRTVVETYECACSRPDNWAMPLRSTVYPVLTNGAVMNTQPYSECGCQGVRGGRHTRLRLRGTPVRGILQVRNGTEVLSPSDYRVDNNGLLTLVDASDYDVCGLEVTYKYGSGIPTSAKVAARVMAEELIRSWSDDEECRLPDRVTNVSRQGVSFTIIDQQDFLDDLRTGIYEVDLFLRTVNPDRARKRAKVFSPDLPRAYRTTANTAPKLAAGAGDARRYDLRGDVGESLQRGFRRYGQDGYAVSLVGQDFRAVVRKLQDPDSDLLLDLTPYLALSGTDDTILELDVPGSVLDDLDFSDGPGFWDLFYWDTSSPENSRKWLEGSFYLDSSVSVGP